MQSTHFFERLLYMYTLNVKENDEPQASGFTAKFYGFLCICLFSQPVFGEVSWEIARGETKKNKLRFITLFPRYILLLIQL